MKKYSYFFATTILFFSGQLLANQSVVEKESDNILDKIENKAMEIGQDLKQTTQDSAITASIKAALLSNKAIKSFSISVTTTDHVVWLKGVVDDLSQIKIAVDIANQIAHVKMVKNEIVLKRDVDWAKAIKNKTGKKIMVQTTPDNMVHLKGDVGTEQEKKLIETMIKDGIAKDKMTNMTMINNQIIVTAAKD